MDNVFKKNQNPVDKVQFLEIYVACFDLKAPASGPQQFYAKLFMMYRSRGNSQIQEWKELEGETECVESLSPSFTKPLKFIYDFEAIQELKICLYQKQNENQPVLIGSYKTTSSKLQSLKKPVQLPELKDEEENTVGKIDLTTVDANLNSSEFSFTLEVKNPAITAAKISFYRKVSRTKDKTIKIFETEEKKKSGSENAALEFQISSLRGNFFPQEINSVKAVIQKETGENEELILQYPLDFISGVALTIQGTATIVNIKNLQEKEKYEFLEYLYNGLQLNLVIGIDYTSSNEKGDPAKNLHTRAFKNNQYVKAISCVSTILLDYDDDKQVPIYGFGGVPQFTAEQRDKNKKSHCFSLTGSEEYPEVEGIEGILAAYMNSLDNVNFSLPTNIAPLIQTVKTQAEKAKEEKSQAFYILLIITDGVFHDQQFTKNLIRSCTKLPMSIIIVGVGSADFTGMEGLDNLRQENGDEMERDLVEFVAFSKCNENMDDLSSEVLKEIPTSITRYYELIGERPNYGFQKNNEENDHLDNYDDNLPQSFKDTNQYKNNMKKKHEEEINQILLELQLV